MKHAELTSSVKDTASLVFKIASEPWEFEKIHELNYQTFVDEIPQHLCNQGKRLVDKFHDENTYFICVKGQELLGMMALRGKRPFSLDQKLDDLDGYLPPFNAVCEIRLLAVKKEHRRSAIFGGILKHAFAWGVHQGYDLAVISGTTRQLKLYTHLGFKRFGPLVGERDALFQPMYLDFTNAVALKRQSRLFQIKRNSALEHLCFNYLPGPVTIPSSVVKANSAEPCSHRGKRFMEDFAEVRRELCARVNGSNVQVMTGSGTLANDVTAAYLTQLSGKGIVVVNGEFGERLRDHAARFGLDFKVLHVTEGEAVKIKDLERQIRRMACVEWIWTVHCETSTGVLNDISALAELCKAKGVKLCVDAISTIGGCHVDLDGVYMATAVSGKGIGSIPGLAMVFYQDKVLLHKQRLPRYLDLAYYEQKGGVPFTISSNAVYALKAALNDRDWEYGFANVRQWSETLCQALEGLGLSIVANKVCRAPHITTIRLPVTVSSAVLGEALEQEGIMVHYLSESLVKRNFIQVCFMGDCQEPARSLVNYLKVLLHR
ncbi:MAG: aminotransferase class V-fold PLP-dependent enzyme [Candidatus Thiodiazotropha sp.]|jgi:aspartate aminotransferase-like enzyme